ncbi:hypothetical protein [Moorena sp. SIO3H5]|uniref:hypothetical protein n=1 Tax=Moorena sp. SIO3H5 TaxID=2607834 RepID=UPI0013BA4700|nr:hypothetical protein [Moorena sp. SIO3H5]NEO73086.1 hypothetical protein [Moorena sp. SIO3H5]
MTDPVYPECIQELYESEIFGEAWALALIEVAKNERDQYQFGTLLQLETETKARLRPFLSKYNMSLLEEMDLSEVDDAVADYEEAVTFSEFSTVTIPTVEAFLARFQAIANIAPEEDQEVVQSMVSHESAILNWLDMESQGNTDGSLDAMIAELQYPLPTP